MKKTTKGAIAAGGAAVLLMGGAGTLAYWTAQGTVSGGSITSGHLSLDATACNAATWTIDGGATFNPATGHLIPGDTLTKTCNVVIDVEGTHFTHVDIQASTQNAFASPWDELTIATTVQGSAAGASNVAVAQGPNNVPVSITVTWPYGTVSTPDATTGADNDLNGDLSTTLNNIVVTAVQRHN